MTLVNQFLCNPAGQSLVRHFLYFSFWLFSGLFKQCKCECCMVKLTFLFRMWQSKSFWVHCSLTCQSAWSLLRLLQTVKKNIIQMKENSIRSSVWVHNWNGWRYLGKMLLDVFLFTPCFGQFSHIHLKVELSLRTKMIVQSPCQASHQPFSQLCSCLWFCAHSPALDTNMKTSHSYVT